MKKAFPPANLALISLVCVLLLLSACAGNKPYVVELVARTFEQLALMNHERDAEKIHSRLKIDHVILIGSDMDWDVFGAYLADGLPKVPQHLSIYISEKDKALYVQRALPSGRFRLTILSACGLQS
jgi:esterase/lipase superfamily enzyme